VIQRGFPFEESVVEMVRSYCEPLKRAEVDTVVLGCTHYPLVAPMLQRILGRDVRLVTAGHAIAATADTGYVDDGPAGRYYAIVAADTCGNVSAPSSLGPNQTVSAPQEGPALAFRLDEILPNPTNGRAPVVRFVLPSAEKARVELVDVAGRRVWAREVTGAGAHAVRVDDGARLGAGIYFVRLTHQGKELVRRLAVLQ